MKYSIVVGLEQPDCAEELMTVAGKRAEIYKARLHSALVQRAHSQACREGLSGEEEMVLVAYHALRQYQRLYECYVELTNKLPAPPVIVPASEALNVTQR